MQLAKDQFQTKEGPRCTKIAHRGFEIFFVYKQETTRFTNLAIKGLGKLAHAHLLQIKMLPKNYQKLTRDKPPVLKTDGYK